MRTRNIIDSDAMDIVALSNQLGYDFTVEKTRVQIDAINNSASDIAFAAVDNNKIVGWIHAFYALRLESHSFCEIAGLVVDEKYRRRGIGKLLISSIQGWCKDKKCNNLRVRCHVKRTEAHKFYEHLGFKETKQQKVFETTL